MKRYKTLILLTFCLVIPIAMISVNPVSAAISPYNGATSPYIGLISDTGHFFHGPVTGRVSLTATWEVSSGPDVDVFIFTQDQYSNWSDDTSVDPTEYVYRKLDTSFDSVTQPLDADTWYIFVVSNENGGGDVTITIIWAWTFENLTPPIPGFELIFVAFGILACALVLYHRRKR